MNRQLYQMGGSIDQARDFFMREKGLDANQTESLIAQGLQAFNTITQPQSMMQMASNGGRIGYQMGGITSMPMDFGQPLQVPQQTSMSMQPMMSSPMANYGETPLTMAGGGIARLGYGFGNFVKGSGVAQPVSGGDTSGGGVIELDARKTGGYIPYGKKERVDDVPAMLAKDEFVFTSRAVKAAGDCSAKRGAAKMYKLMKQLEAKGRKMEQGARA